MCQRWVDDQAEQDHEQNVSAETNAPSEAARNQSGCDDCKLQLKECKKQEGNGFGKIPVGDQAYPSEGEVRSRITDDATDGVPEAQTEPGENPYDADNAERHKALQHGGNNVLFIHHPSIEEGQAALALIR